MHDTPPDRRFGLLAGAIILLLSAAPAAARTFCFPHVFETRGRISNTPYTFDTTLFFNYAGAVSCVGGSETDQTVEVYLYSDSGQPMWSENGSAICAPCTITLGATDRAAPFSLEAAATAAGGMPDALSGFAVVTVSGDDVANVSPQALIVNAHTSAFDLSVFGFSPQEVAAATAKNGASFPCGRVFSVGRVLATGGASPDTPYSFDTTLFFTYAAGRGGLTTGPGATVETYLFDDTTGELLTDAVGTPVCNPCVTALSEVEPKGLLSVGAALPGGQIVSAAVSAVCVVSGDAGNVTPQAFVVNRHTSPFDVSMYGPEFREITSTGTAAIPAVLAERLGLRSYPNPFNPRTTFAYALPEPGAVRVGVYNADGALVRTLLSEAQPAGDHEVAWDGRGDDGRLLPSGVYFGRIDAGGSSETQKVMLVK